MCTFINFFLPGVEQRCVKSAGTFFLLHLFMSGKDTRLCPPPSSRSCFFNCDNEVLLLLAQLTMCYLFSSINFCYLFAVFYFFIVINLGFKKHLILSTAYQSTFFIVLMLTFVLHKKQTNNAQHAVLH